MDVLAISLPTINKFSSDYLNGKEELQAFFTYNPFSDHCYQERYDNIIKREFKREELVEYLRAYNLQFNAGEKTFENIETLLDEKSVVVVGGQQAGLLTGPLYTISKIISIICLAKEQEQLLNKPVIPLFWIAGEDHDFLEINHVFVQELNRLKKKSFHDPLAGKKMVSDLIIDKQAMNIWVQDVFHRFGESEHTKELVASLESYINQSESYVDFFSFIVSDLFQSQGLVLMNAADSKVREMESSYFTLLMKKNREITNAVLQTQKELSSLNYSETLDIPSTAMNMFIHIDGERRLLHWNEEKEQAYTEQGNSFSLEELFSKVEQSPQTFSNNVVTRPIMQELLLPTLAFIAGPGEIAYWAELKGAFSSINIEMPPVVPRLTFTLLEREIFSLLEELNVSLDEALDIGVEEKRKLWLYENELNKMEETLLSLSNEYREMHHKYRQLGEEIVPHLQPVFEKNWLRVDQEFNYMKTLMERSAYEKHQHLMNKYERVQLALKPNNAPQERIMNVYYYMNKYGKDLPNRICEKPFKHDGKHKVVLL
ncbi:MULTISPECIES: bacillithiol biosynthesis cysteine-adding enzyme BshC [Sutcliffiella]|uniref:Putative cysteine ligase BshC n=1 Tax=Sutcliffiella cohnii TaxID=33932 RepID=A0A223KRP1_9BACI|nr:MULTISPECIES: bacillithiol biosynthesis cysteine-adding enzyme BshC [Sutcliffiella]AST92152.1 bacillithiol biosynthesis cysteine-adding enzyme BshC [Sutcliffiella cohnii]WBL13384.1 bacillithiol biosynthesis cysteine-adding enzyme BshC [Sutcliffiella sp. NC1]